MNALLGNLRNRPALRSFLGGGALFLLPSLLSAHPGHEGVGGFASGFLHPFSGPDHLCAMIAVGLWAAGREGRARWTAPLLFMGMMAVGGGLGMAGLTVPFAEAGILASVLVLGLLVAAAVRLPLSVGLGLIALFALFHGYAHGVEMPAAASASLYGSGFLLSTFVLHLAGLAFGLGMRHLEKETVLRYAGAAIAAIGVALVVG